VFGSIILRASHQALDSTVAIDPHSRTAIWDVCDQQEGVGLLATEVHAGAQRALLQHDGLGDVGQPSAVDAVWEQAPVAHQPPHRTTPTPPGIDFVPLRGSSVAELLIIYIKTCLKYPFVLYHNNNIYIAAL